MKLYIVGYGEMAKAIAYGLKNGYELAVVGRNEEKMKKFCDEVGISEYHNIDNFDITDKNIILAVKPYVLDELRFSGKANILISIMAGKKISLLKKIPAKFYLRAMPNVAARNKASTTTITGDLQIKDEMIKLFENIGDVIWVDTEKELDIATAIAGSGPAFLAMVEEAIMDGGVVSGLKRELAYKLTKSLFKSFATLDEHPALIKDKVMSPDGTTASGVDVLEKNKIRSAFIEAIKKSYEKSQNI